MHQYIGIKVKRVIFLFFTVGTQSIEAHGYFSLLQIICAFTDDPVMLFAVVMLKSIGFVP